MIIPTILIHNVKRLRAEARPIGEDFTCLQFSDGTGGGNDMSTTVNFVLRGQDHVELAKALAETFNNVAMAHEAKQMWKGEKVCQDEIPY